MVVAHTEDGSPSVDVVVLTALALEARAVVQALSDCSEHVWRRRTLRVGDVNGLRVLVFPMDCMGNVGSAEAATRVIGIWNPAYLLVVGIAGGARNDGDGPYLGDVLVADQVVGYEPGKAQPGGLERRYEVYRPDHRLLAAAHGLEQRNWAGHLVTPRPDGQTGRIQPQARFGPVLAGEKVLADDSTMENLRSHWPKAIGAEMEGLGVAVASYRGGPGFLLAKAVSDFADTAKNDDWQPYAAEAAARFAVALLRNVALPREARRPQAQPITAPVVFSGRVKVKVCHSLLDDWEDVADLFDVPPHHKARFRPGNEPRGLWEWLEARGKLAALPDMLTEIGRADLAQVMRSSTP
ncbi:hypothetical protein WB401_39195 [Streptomyces brasiliscabiei]|uniref:Nucleoside phosphorylase domain-containing protein n=1 Tax=Streptomyces brasiliscabiei TaxID=2736302 RepID=A0ABU8GT00_9ACTN